MMAAVLDSRIVQKEVAGTKFPEPSVNFHGKISTLGPTDRVFGTDFLCWIVMGAVGRMAEAANPTVVWRSGL